MGRWEPDARGRLMLAALELYTGRGYEQTTVADIAERAGVTERTFFRHFADKREVLFFGLEMTQDRLTRAVADAPADATPIDVVSAALQALGALLQENPQRVRLRESIVSAHPELRERELIKLAAMGAAMTAALRDRGIADPAASLAAEAGIALFKVAFARWIADSGHTRLPDILRESVQQMRSLFDE